MAESIYFVYRVLFCLLLFFFCCFDEVEGQMITGYIVPHSHDDVGWLATINGYFDFYVRNIYDTMIEALAANPARRFISVEMAFFSKWWYQASPSQQQQAINLVKQGQLEFIVGGWTMEDEACTTYSANIDQMTEGHLFIESYFGPDAVPRYGWQIDPFGHSSVVHGQFAQMGFQGTVLDRIDYREKAAREASKSLQFLWSPSQNFDSQDLSIFTHAMDHYMYITAVHSLEWDSLDPPVTDSNIRTLADSIVDNIVKRSEYFQTSDILFPWGDDFQHFYAVDDFNNMDKLLNYINQHSEEYGVQVQYALLSDFFNALHSSNHTWPMRDSQDFFPYADSEASEWTGYYTSRVALKGYVRSRENVLKTTEYLHTLSLAPWGTRSEEGDLPAITVLRRANGEATHHDAVAGTAEPYVVKMYDEHLQNGTETVAPVAGGSMSSLMSTEPGYDPSMHLDPTILESLSPSNPITVSVFNPTPWQITRFISIPAFQEDTKIVLLNGSTVPFDLLPSIPNVQTPCQYPGTCSYPYSNVTSPLTLHFEATLPALGFQVFVVSVASEREAHRVPSLSYTRVQVDMATIEDLNGEAATIGNSNLQLTFDPVSKLLTGVTNLRLNQTLNLTQYLGSYTNQGDTAGFSAAAGAYVFHPLGVEPTMVTSDALSLEFVQGNFVSEARQTFTVPCENPDTSFTCGVTQVFRVFRSNDHVVESFVESLVSAGPLAHQTDLVAVFNTTLQNNGVFFTDDNCFEVQQRARNMTMANPVGGNYYPVTCGIFLQDETREAQLTLLVDRTRGGSSIQDGELEIALHRRILSSDWKGPLNLDDQDHISHLQTLIIFDGIQQSAFLRHHLQYTQQFSPSVFYGSSVKTSSVRSSWSALQQPFPLNAFLLSLNHILPLNQSDSAKGKGKGKGSTASEGSTPLVVLRVEHIFESYEDSYFSQPINLTLSDYFSFAQLESMDERSLSVALPLAEVLQRNTWNGQAPPPVPIPPTAANNYTISLTPKQIRTFLINLASPS